MRFQTLQKAELFFFTQGWGGGIIKREIYETLQNVILH